jgi:hypothetical protein
MSGKENNQLLGVLGYRAEKPRPAIKPLTGKPHRSLRPALLLISPNQPSAPSPPPCLPLRLVRPPSRISSLPSSLPLLEVPETPPPTPRVDSVAAVPPLADGSSALHAINLTDSASVTVPESPFSSNDELYPITVADTVLFPDLFQEGSTIANGGLNTERKEEQVMMSIRGVAKRRRREECGEEDEHDLDCLLPGY